MDRGEYIALDKLCDQYELEMAFFTSLDDYDLIRVVRVEQAHCIHRESLGQIEKIVRLHKDLDINVAGIDTVLNLLERIEHMQHELRILRSRLALYE